MELRISKRDELLNGAEKGRKLYGTENGRDPQVGDYVIFKRYGNKRLQITMIDPRTQYVEAGDVGFGMRDIKGMTFDGNWVYEGNVVGGL